MDFTKNRYIARKSDVWDRVKNGALMSLTFDLETTGLGMQGNQYKTPHDVKIVQYGAVGKDISGNIHQQLVQLDIRLDDTDIMEPGSAILLRKTPQELRSDKRIDHRKAMAMVAWHAEQMLFAYEDIAKQLGDALQTAAITDFNKQFTQGQKEAVETFYDIPLLGDDGEIVRDVRFHPARQKISIRISQDGGKDYWGGDNLYYKDERDGSLWRWQDMSLYFETYNGANYDIPVLMKNMADAGYHPSNTVFMRSRATVTNKQRRKNYHLDVMKLAEAVALFGPQGTNGLKLNEYIDSHGKIRFSKKLGQLFKANERSADMQLFDGEGLQMLDRSFFDDPAAHDALYDTMATAALSTACQRIAPDIYNIVSAQADKAELISSLMARSASGDDLDLFVMPEGTGQDQKPQAYYFWGSDDAMGKFNQLVFLKTDGSFHKGNYAQMNASDWKAALSARDRSDLPVRLVNFNKRPGILPFEYVIRNSHQGKHFVATLNDIAKDLIFIQKNPEMVTNIMQALSDLNSDRRFYKYKPQVPALQDEHLDRISPQVHYMDAEVAKAKRRSNSRKGAQQVNDVVLLVQSTMQNTYDLMRSVDMASNDLALVPHAIEYFEGIDISDRIHEQLDADGQPSDLGRMAAKMFENFNELCERSIQLYERKNIKNYAEILRSIKQPDGKPFFDGLKFKAETIGEALYFRQALRKRAALDYQTALNSKQPVLQDFAKGIVDKNYCRMTEKGQPLFLFADAYNGEKGSTPFMADEQGREIPMHVLKSIETQRANTYLLYKKSVDNNRWNSRFYRMRSDPSMQILSLIMAKKKESDFLPDDSAMHALHANYQARKLYNDPHIKSGHEPRHTIDTVSWEIKRMQAGLSSQTQNLETPASSQLSVSKGVVTSDESKMILDACASDINRLKRKYTRKSHDAAMVHFDEKTGAPYPYIDQIVRRNSAMDFNKDKNFITLDVPLRHVFNPVAQDGFDLPFKGLVAQNIAQHKLKSIQAGKKLLVRIPETGQIFAAARPSLHDLTPRLLDTHAEIIEKATIDYALSGQPLTQSDQLHYIGFEDLHPLANTAHDINHGHAGLILPHNQFYALTAPMFANMGDKPITAVILPSDYVAQKLEAGKTINLYEGEGRLFENFDGKTLPEIGNMYQTTLTQVITDINLQDLNAQVTDGTIDTTIFEEAGYLGVDDFNVRALKWSAGQRKPNVKEQKFVIARFEPVNQNYKQGRGYNEQENSWRVVFNHGAKPRAAFSWDHAPVGADAYTLNIG